MKRLSRIAKASAYSLLAVAIIGLTVLLVTIGKGYFFDFKTGQIAGGGLILLDSRPDGAAVFLDGRQLNKNTPTRVPLRDGAYQLKLDKSGYRPWQKKLNVSTAEVTWAQYPLLLPDTISTEAVVPLEAPSRFAQSPDAKWLVWASGGPQPKIQMLETGKTELKTALVLAPEQLAAGLAIDSITWSPDNEHLLVGLRSPQQLQYVVISAHNPAEAANISVDFGLPLANLQFSPRNWRELYWPSPEGLRKLDLANRTVSAVLAPAVSSFLVSDEAVFFVQTKDALTQLARLERDNQSRVLIENLPPGDYQLEYINFNNRQYLAILNRTSHSVSLYHSTTTAGQYLQPFEQVAADRLVVSPDDRYLLMQAGANFATYEVEFERLDRFSLALPKVGEISWLDPHHLLTDAGGSISLFEFDGGNPESITASVDGFPAFGSRNQEFVYSVGRSGGDGSLVLQASRLKR